MTVHASRGEAKPTRRIGYLVAVIMNVVIWVIVNVSPGWQELPFLTGDFTSILSLVNLTLVTSALVNAAYLLFDPAWFKSVTQIGVLAIGLAAAIRMWQVFPFDFAASSIPWTGITRTLLILAILGSVVAIISEVVKLAGLAGGQVNAGGAGSRTLPRS